MTYFLLVVPVFLGYLMVNWVKEKRSVLPLLLSFSGAYLLSVTVLHLLPEVFTEHSGHGGLFILFGIALQTGLEHLSKGAEHGHLHQSDFQQEVPWLLLISLNIHAFLEGMPLGMEHSDELLWAVMIHKVPVALVLAMFLANSSLSKVSVALILLTFGLMSPLGGLLSDNLPWIKNHATAVNGLIVGVFLHISNAILYESSENHQFNRKRFIAIAIGFVVALISL